LGTNRCRAPTKPGGSPRALGGRLRESRAVRPAERIAFSAERHPVIGVRRDHERRGLRWRACVAVLSGRRGCRRTEAGPTGGPARRARHRPRPRLVIVSPPIRRRRTAVARDLVRSGRAPRALFESRRRGSRAPARRRQDPVRAQRLAAQWPERWLAETGRVASARAALAAAALAALGGRRHDVMYAVLRGRLRPSMT
jgi:hypothetical protein